VLSPADDVYHIDKTKFRVPFVCGARNLSEALRRIAEGATMIRTKGEPGTGDVVQAVKHMRLMQSEIRRLKGMAEDELYEAAKQLQAPYDLVKYVHDNGKRPVVNFEAGGVATPADAALMMMLGMPFDFPTLLGFILMLGVTMVAAPGVPGGAIMAALGILGSMLGFDANQQGLMISLYIAMDSFGTACNVTGDGAIALIINRIAARSTTMEKRKN
jgi:hypothetical protein